MSRYHCPHCGGECHDLGHTYADTQCTGACHHPPKAAIAKLAKQLDGALDHYQANVRPWLVAMSNHDSDAGRHVSSMRREEVRDTLDNRIGEAVYRVQQFRDTVEDGRWLRQQASDYDEGIPRRSDDG